MLPTGTSSDSHAFFRQIAWCNQLLSQPDIIVSEPGCRTEKPSTEDTLFGRTLKIPPTTISHALSFYPRPTANDVTIPYISNLFSLGDGMNGFPDMLHGGIIAAILDESMGILLSRISDLVHMREVGLGKKSGEWAETLDLYTVELNIKYKRPVKTPGMVISRADITKHDGRKMWLKATISQPDGNGELKVCAEAVGLFVEPKHSKL